jgi:hypothetical protein
MTAAGPDRDHFHCVRAVLAGAKAVDDAVALGPPSRQVETEPSAAFQIAAHQAGPERLADPAPAGQVADSSECRVDKLLIDCCQGSKVVEDLG